MEELPNLSTFYSTSSAARALGVHERTLRLWLAAGKLPHTVTTTLGRLFDPEDIRRLRDDRRRQSAGARWESADGEAAVSNDR